MTVLELIHALRAHGVDPEADVLAWDPDGEGWFPVTGFTYGGGEATVKLYCDSDEEGEEPEQCRCCSGPGFGVGEHDHTECEHPCCPENDG